MSSPLRSIVIVGGGTAGWMAALTLSSRFPDKTITVIDPVKLGAIGVGESVTGVVLNLVNDPLLGLNRSDFFTHADATLKLGIWFRDWQGPGTEYIAPIDNPKSYFEDHYPEALEEFYALAAADGVQLGKAQIHAHLMRANQTDYIRRDGIMSDQFAHASCHLDALKFADWLRQSCRTRENVIHLDDAIARFEQEPETGFVTRLITEGGQTVEGDFFLDCSGFHRLLLEPAFRPEWVDYSSHIKVDRAIPCMEPHPEGETMPVFTTARAMPNGWMWEIPTQSRLGKGYLFSSRHVSEEDAIDEMRAAGADPGENPSIISFQPGKLKDQWRGNVCAIGLAGGFLEALEATTIHGMNAQISLLADLFLPYYSREASFSLSKRYNSLIDVMYTDYVDFISFHYHAGRSDTAFWREYQETSSITAANLARMDMWKYSFPHREDFSPVHTTRTQMTSSLPVWMPMLCGMGYLNKAHAQQMVACSPQANRARANLNRYLQFRTMLDKYGVSQREAIEYLCST